MDALQETVIRLYEKNLSLKEISRRTKTSEQKVRRILITVGLWSNPLTETIQQMSNDGKSVDEIAAELNMRHNAVLSYMPYIKCMYNAEYPSKNALKIRACKERKMQQGVNDGEQTT